MHVYEPGGPSSLTPQSQSSTDDVWLKLQSFQDLQFFTFFNMPPPSLTVYVCLSSLLPATQADTLTSRSAIVPVVGGSAGPSWSLGVGLGDEGVGCSREGTEPVGVDKALVWNRICWSVRRRLGWRRACVW